MKIKCEYCGNFISDTDEKCPNCMAVNNHLKRVGNEVPTTIEELKIWYHERNLPPENITRFFIGKNVHEARAFGIYLDESTGNYVVYKNKDTGERAIRYEGKDENYAVNELYMKLKEEIQHQKGLNASAKNYNYPKQQSNKLGSKILKTILIIYLMSFIIPVMLLSIISNLTLVKGYYYYNKQPYYLYDTCIKPRKDNCELYKYNVKTNTWESEKNNDKINIYKFKYIGDLWNNKYGITIKKELKDEDWFKEIHPPTPKYSGYYNYDGKIYYYYFHNWYIYEDDQWKSTSVSGTDMNINPDNYYDSDTSSKDTYGFSDSSYSRNSYDNSSDDDSSWSSSDDSSWDSGSTWDSSDSWDSGSTDWSSDW